MSKVIYSPLRRVDVVCFLAFTVSVAHYWRGAISASVWELVLVVQTQPRKDKAKTRLSIPTTVLRRQTLNRLVTK
jgi:hypothetical protein